MRHGVALMVRDADSSERQAAGVPAAAPLAALVLTGPGADQLPNGATVAVGRPLVLYALLERAADQALTIGSRGVEVAPPSGWVDQADEPAHLDRGAGIR